jgi:hypothetical protein
VIVFVVKRNTLEKAALDLEIFITFQAATDMAEFWIIYSSSPTSPTTQRQSKKVSEGWQKILFCPNPAACYLPKLAKGIRISSL